MMDWRTQIQVGVARVASSIPAELTRQFSPLAKTTALESKILIAVARADIIVCEVGKVLLYALAAVAVGGLAALVCEYYRRRRGNFARRAKLSRPKGPGWHGSNQRFETRHLRRR